MQDTAGVSVVHLTLEPPAHVFNSTGAQVYVGGEWRFGTCSVLFSTIQWSQCKHHLGEGIHRIWVPQVSFPSVMLTCTKTAKICHGIPADIFAVFLLSNLLPRLFRSQQRAPTDFP